MASRLIRNQLPSRVAGSTPVSSAFDAFSLNEQTSERLATHLPDLNRALILTLKRRAARRSTSSSPTGLL